jgi:hypothetical protein
LNSLEIFFVSHNTVDGALTGRAAKEEAMPKRKGKTVSFDAMVKFFMQNYEIPTKQDVDRIIARLDQLEALIRSQAEKAPPARPKSPRRRGTTTAVDTVLDIIRRSDQGIGFAEIQAKTGFAEKKIRNIIFRLNQAGAIRRRRRGIYETD